MSEADKPQIHEGEKIELELTDEQKRALAAVSYHLLGNALVELQEELHRGSIPTTIDNIPTTEEDNEFIQSRITRADSRLCRLDAILQMFRDAKPLPFVSVEVSGEPTYVLPTAVRNMNLSPSIQASTAPPLITTPVEFTTLQTKATRDALEDIVSNGISVARVTGDFLSNKEQILARVEDVRTRFAPLIIAPHEPKSAFKISPGPNNQPLLETIVPPNIPS